jgi:protein-disulfide isomerase
MSLSPPISRRAALGALAAAAAAAPAFAQQAAAVDASPAALAARGYAVGDMSLGDPAAPLKVIEYSSLTCPHCANFHTATWPEIKARYVDAGKVHWTLREVYFDQFGLWASMIARCGGPEAFFPQIDTFFARQAEWTKAQDIVAELQRVGRLNGLPADRMQACLGDEGLMTRLVEDFQANTTRDAVRSTPTFLIGGEPHTGFMTVAAFSALLDAKLPPT